MMKLSELETALAAGPSVLSDVLAEVAELNCPKASGFEGPDTFSDCGKCIVCLAKQALGYPCS